MHIKFKPDPLPQRPGRRVTYGKNLTLWEPSRQRYGDKFSVEHLILRLRKSEIDAAAEAVAVVMAQMFLGTMGDCVVEPNDGEFITITWPADQWSFIDQTPPFIYQFLEEYALVSREHKTEAESVRRWILSNFTPPF